MPKLNVTLDPATEEELGGVLSSPEDFKLSVDPDSGIATMNGFETIAEIIDAISGEVI